MSIASLMPVYPRCPVEPVRGEGSYLFDESGRRWLDFASGIAVNTLGHGDPRLVEAIAEQARRLIHVSNLYGSPQQRKVADRLVELTFADTVFFTNSGAESVECAIKLCRRYHSAQGRSRPRILTFSQSFHGRTLGTIAAAGQDKLTAGFEPLLPGFTSVPLNDREAVIAALADDVGAILVEPVQGEGGIRPLDPWFARFLRALCDEQDMLLAFDEVQSGIGRTGTLFAYEQLGIVPDVLASAKGLGGGFPVGACLASEKAARGMTFGTHGSTYGGNPLAMAAVDAVLNVVADPVFLATVQQRGDSLRGELEDLVKRFPSQYRGVRGMGLMLGLQTHGDSRAFVSHLRDHGLLTVAAGDNIVRILPPLTVTTDEIAEAVDGLARAAITFGRKAA